MTPVLDVATSLSSKAIDIPLPNGLTLRGLCWGDKSKPCVIALHGWMDNAATFAELAPLLTDDIHIIALEMAGHGWSDHRPLGCRYHLLDNVDDVLLAIEELNLAQFHLMGHSLGASIAAYVAALKPNGLQSLICLEGLGSLTMESKEALNVLHDGVRSHKQLLSRQRRPLPTPFATEQDAIALRTQGLFPLSEIAAQHLTLRALRATEGGWHWRTDARLKGSSTYRLTEEIVLSYLRGIQVPSLLVGAESGYFGRTPVLAERASAVEDCVVTGLPGGHHFHLEPDTVSAVGKIVRVFLHKQLSQ